MVTNEVKEMYFKTTCRYCEKEIDISDEKNHWRGASICGNNDGDGKELGKNILGVKYMIEVKAAIKNHDLYLTKWDTSKTEREWDTAPQAHHLICLEAMRDSEYWKDICWYYGYNINCKENGVYLPANMRLACQLRIPLHRGGHSAGYGSDENSTISYPNAVKKELEKLKKSIKKLECNNQKGATIINDLNALSKEIFDNLKNFKWTITYDGFDYKDTSRIGCAGCTTFKAKKEKFKSEFTNAANQVNHDRRLAGDEAILKSSDEIFKKISICPRTHFLNTAEKYTIERSR
jgi:hypothetical protein